MNRSTLLAWLFLCPVLLFTGCTGDDQSNTNGQNTGNDATNHYCSTTLPAFPPRGITLTPSDNSGPIRIDNDAGDGYTLLLHPTADPENGTSIFSASGDMASLVLTPNTGDPVRDLNLVFKTSMEGTYTSDSLGQGTFTLDSPLSWGCGPY